MSRSAKPLYQTIGVPVIVIAMECRIDRDTDDATRPQFLELRGIRVQIDDRDALEAAVAFRNRIEHARIVASVAGIWLHQERMLHPMALHHLDKLRGGANFLSGRLVGHVFAVRKIRRIDHVGVAVNLRLVENVHRVGAADQACARDVCITAAGWFFDISPHSCDHPSIVPFSTTIFGLLNHDGVVL